VKIRSTVCKKENNSPRLNNENINLIKRDPETFNTYGNKREELKIKEFMEPYKKSSDRR
jgi:ssDNA-binding replication factor A large subunit